MATDAEITQLIGAAGCPFCRRSCREGTYRTVMMPDAITKELVEVLVSYQCPCGEVAGAQLAQWPSMHIAFKWQLPN